MLGDSATGRNFMHGDSVQEETPCMGIQYRKKIYAWGFSTVRNSMHWDSATGRNSMHGDSVQEETPCMGIQYRKKIYAWDSGLKETPYYIHGVSAGRNSMHGNSVLEENLCMGIQEEIPCMEIQYWKKIYAWGFRKKLHAWLPIQLLEETPCILPKGSTVLYSTKMSKSLANFKNKTVLMALN